MNKIVAVVTTYNRLNLLKENIYALLGQDYKFLDVMIVNNNSSDGTEEYVRSLNESRIIYYNTGENLGGAGGFSFGVKKAIEAGYDFTWLMDDDTIPQQDALGIIVEKIEILKGKFSYLASTIYWTDGTLFPMNLPTLAADLKMDVKNIRDYKLLKIATCSFVGCFVNLKYAIKVGLPIAEYFIYGDDVEYTTRLCEQESAYWVIDSTLVHKAPSKVGSNVVNISADRIDRFYMQTRNGVHLHRQHGGKFKYFKILCQRMKGIVLRSPDHKLKRLSVVFRGILVGLFFNPKIEYVKNEEVK